MADVLRFFDEAQIRDPYPRYAQWRERHPIWYDGDSGRWVLSRHEDVLDILKDHRRFSSAAMGQGHCRCRRSRTIRRGTRSCVRS